MDRRGELGTVAGLLERISFHRLGLRGKTAVCSKALEQISKLGSLSLGYRATRSLASLARSRYKGHHLLGATIIPFHFPLNYAPIMI